MSIQGKTQAEQGIFAQNKRPRHSRSQRAKKKNGQLRGGVHSSVEGCRSRMRRATS